MARPLWNWIVRFLFIIIGAVFLVLYLQEPDPAKANLYLIIFIVVLVVEMVFFIIYYYILARRR